jgi:putative Holliday junction resolvase
METVMGFDYGRKRIGIAIGQTLTLDARGLDTVANRGGKPDWDHIQRLVNEWQPQRLIVGLPFNMDDSEQTITEEARRFGRRLEGRHRIPVETVDERLSSREAWREMIDQGQRPDTIRKHIDAEAARIILHTWFETR